EVCRTRSILRRGKDRRRIVGNADRDPGFRTKAVQAFDTREVEAQARRANLHSESRFGSRLCPQGPITGTRIGAPVYLACQTEALVQAIYSGSSVSENIILREEIGGRCKN